MTHLEIYAVALVGVVLGALAYLWWVSPSRRAILSPIIAGLLGFLAAIGLRSRRATPRKEEASPEPEQEAPTRAPEIGAPIDFEVNDETTPDGDSVPDRPPDSASDERRASEAIDWWNTHNWD